MRGSRVLAAFVIAGLALVLVVISISSASADESSIERDTALLAPAATITVTSAANDGPGTLHEALSNAGSGDVIGFDTGVFPPSNPQTITLSSALPDITQGNLTIDASNAGVILYGSGTPVGTDGLVINGASSVTVRGLQVLGFPSDGIVLRDGAMSNTVEGNVISGNGENGMAVFGSGTMSNTISGNYIGTDVSGTMTMTNQHSGISMWSGSSYNIIENNLISGNGGNGIEISSGTAHNVVRGNEIGTDVSGLFALPNGADGVLVENGATHNTIGGDTLSERNLISGNNADGIDINGSSTMSNTVSGNYIGTNITGTAAIGNGDQGVQVGEGASYNLIGGDTEDERNLISGNANIGVSISGSGTMSNTVSGNYIGVDASGTVALGNTSNGVFINDGAHHNVVGGTTAAERNIVSGSSANQGIHIMGGHANTIIGNYIGVDASGTVALGNQDNGILISHGAQHNAVGGDNAGERNIISGNMGDGVRINGTGTMSNTISGNYIGTDVNGTVALGNERGGVELNDGASNNLVGGDTAAERNLISGNSNSGVSIYGSTTTNNTVRGNYIGIDAGGTAFLSNAGDGVYIGGGASNNLIGGANGSPGGVCSGDCNLISGNGGDGIAIRDSGTMSNTVSGNYIGIDVSGTVGLGNGVTEDGVGIRYGPAYNVIGGDTPGERNVIGANGDNGVKVDDAMYNTIIGNYIGTDASGTAAIGNAEDGVAFQGGASYNRIGSDTVAERNLISGNGLAGVDIRGGSTDNIVSGNYIGTNISGTAPLANAEHGVAIVEGASYNTVGGAAEGEQNLIAHNASGVQIDGASSVENRITHNSVYSNTGKGIALSGGANDYMFPPLLTEVTATGVKGTAVPSATIEVFSDDDDEGRWYHGSTVADATGYFTFTAAFTGTNVTATATDQDGNTSEFSSPYHPSRDVVVAAIYVPQQRHEVNVPITPTVRVGNGGTAPESFTVTAVITRGSDGAQVYSITQSVVNLGVFHYRTLAFPVWTPLDTGSYTFEVLVQTGTPDDNPSNDRRIQAFVVADDRVDVWARDNLTDDGQEPSGGSSWQSPDVWVRNAADGGTIHQDPINAITNTVYLTVSNRGTLTATGVAATVYWHPPALVIGQSWWQPIDTVTMTELAPGAAQVVSMSWPLAIEELTGPYHTCLLGVLTSTEDLAPVVWDVRGSNNLIQRNVDVIPQQAVGGGMDLDLVASAAVSSAFDVGNPYPGEQLVDVIVDASGVPAGVELWIDLGGLFARWEQVGQGSLVGAVHVSGTTVVTVAGGTQAEITGIPMAGEELVEIAVEIYRLDGGQSVQIDVSERIGGDVLGGITLDVTAVEYKVYLPLVLRSD